MLVILYVFEVIKYCAAYNICFNKKVKGYEIFAIGAFGCILVMVFGRSGGMPLMHIMMYLISFCVVFLMPPPKCSSLIKSLFYQ